MAQVATYGTSGTLAVASTGVAYAQGMSAGNWAVIASVGLGLVSAALVKAYADMFKTKAAGILELAKAKADADAYRERLEMKVQSEWDELNAASMKGQLVRLQLAVEADRARTEEANQKLHDLKTVAQRDLFSRDEKIAQLMAEIKALRDKESAGLNILAVSQVRQDAQIDANHVTTVENKAAIEDLKAERSGEMPVFRPEGPTGG